MISRLEIISKIADTRAAVLKRKIASQGFSVSDVVVVDVYTIEKQLTSKELKQISEMLTNPVVAESSFAQMLAPQKFQWAVEIGFQPGVTDNVATTTREMIEDLVHAKFRNGEGVYTSQLLFLSGKINAGDSEKIIKSLHNPLIQKARSKNFAQFKIDRGMGKLAPRVKLTGFVKVDKVNLNVGDEELVKIGKQGIANRDGSRRGPLALGLDYLKAIQTYFKKAGRNPTDIELESLAQTWSEHCKHTIFADPLDEIKDGLFRHYIKRATEEIRERKSKAVIARREATKQSGNRSSRFAHDYELGDYCVSVFTDNSGAIEFDQDYLITHKVETHNSPSALDPFGGAITGIVGVNRDTIGFGLGAKPIANTYGFCFAPPTDNTPLYKGPNKTQPMLSPRRIMDGVIAGVNSGGNCSGIPTPLGFMFFDKRYKGKPLVFVGTIGLIPKKKNSQKLFLKKARPGDYIVMIGGRVGLDGIHGATFSSEAMDSGSPAGAVQIGDPITQKKLSDALVKEARDLGLYNSITDNGAGGLSCSIAEMAKEMRLPAGRQGGCEVQLEKVPLKYPGLAPWQIWISESQERMTLAVPKLKWKKFQQLMYSRGVEATIIGTFSSSRKCLVKYKGSKIMDIDMDFLHNGLPGRHLTSSFSVKKYQEPKLPSTKNLSEILTKMLSRLSITSNEFISMQYDHEVQGNSVLKPLQGKGRVNADAAVIRPLEDSHQGVILSHALYPTYSDIDTYHMAAASIDTAVRNLVAMGADPTKIALLDNFCWCSSTEPQRLGQLKRAARACYDLATIYNTPFISGKDSMFNDFKGYDESGNPLKISVPPTLLISAISVVKDISNVVSLDAKFPGDLIYIVGETFDEMGGSEYFNLLSRDDLVHIGNSVPQVNAHKNKKMYLYIFKAIQSGLIASAQSVGRGGLAVALTKIALGGMLGLEINLKKLPGKTSRDDFALFSESQGRIIVTVAPGNKRKFEKLLKGNAFGLLGTISNKPKIQIRGIKGNKIVDFDLKEAELAYKKTFRDY